MRRGLDVAVTVDACIDLTVDGMLQLLLIHIEADTLAVQILGQSCISVTGQTVLVSGFLLGRGCPGPSQDTNHDTLVQNSARGIHGI